MSKAMKARKPMSAKSKGAICLALLLALTIFVSWIGIGGMKLDSEGVNILLPWVPVSSENWPASLPLSRALGGGSYVEFTAALPEGSEEGASIQDALKAAAEIMKERLDSKGLTDAAVTVKEDNILRVELPKLEADDLASVIAMVSAPAAFEFRTADGETFMTGEHIKQAGVGYADNSGSSYALGLTTTDEGKQLLADATTAHTGETLSIYRDGVLLVSATVSQAFTTGQISVPLGMTLDETVDVAVQMNAGALDVSLTQTAAGELENNGVGALRVILIAAAVLLLAALIYMVAVGKLTGIAGIWTVWCAILLEMFFYATIVLATVTVPIVIALLLGIVLAIYAAAVRTQAISKQIADGSAPKSAAKLGFRAAAKQVWLAHGAVLVVSLVLMLFSFSKVLGYALCAGVVASAMVTPLMRAFQACFTSMTGKPGLFGKAK